MCCAREWSPSYLIGRTAPFCGRRQGDSPDRVKVPHWFTVAGLRGRPSPFAQTSRTSTREVAVLTLLGDGLTAAAIGRQLNIAESTVNTNLEHVYRKRHERPADDGDNRAGPTIDSAGGGVAAAP
jgi:DNA-binding CsgD family transcriptional regulator